MQPQLQQGGVHRQASLELFRARLADVVARQVDAHDGDAVEDVYSTGGSV